MKPFEFWSLAQRLLETEKNAAGFRSVTSRAYYAAFLTALDFLEQMGISLAPTADSHKRATQILDRAGDNAVVEISRMLDNLRGERNDADYEMKNRDVEKEEYASLRCQDAGKIITTLNACCGNQQRFATVKANTLPWANRVLGRPS